MAIGFVGSLAPVGANNGGNVTLAFSNLQDSGGSAASLQQGDVVVCAYASSGTADAAMSTSSTGWTEVHENYANGSSVDTNLALYYKVMGASPDTSFVGVGPGGSSNATIGVAFAFRGVDGAVIDTAFNAVSHSATGTGTTKPNPPAITPTTAGAWIVVAGAGGSGAGAAFTNPGDLSGTTNHFRSSNHAETNDMAIGLGIKTNWSSGAFDPAAWGGGADAAGASWASIVITLKPLVESVGTLSKTEASDTVSAGGAVRVAASLAKAEAGDAIASTGTALVRSSLSKAEAGDTISATGTVQSPGANATLSVTEAGDSVSSAGVVRIVGSMARNEASDVLAALGTVSDPTSTGVLNYIEAGDILVASGKVPGRRFRRRYQSGDYRNMVWGR